MGNLISKVKRTSDREFDIWLSTVPECDKMRLMEMRSGLKQRDIYISQHDKRFMPYMTNTEKMDFIKACYGWIFAVIEKEFPFAAQNPKDVSSFTWHVVNVHINHLFLPEDQKMLMLA